MQSMWCHRSLGSRLHTACQKPQEEITLCKGQRKKSSFQEKKSDGKGRGGSSNYPIVEVYKDGSKTQTSHMKVLPGYAVLDLWCCQESVWSETCRSDGTDMCTRW